VKGAQIATLRTIQELKTKSKATRYFVLQVSLLLDHECHTLFTELEDERGFRRKFAPHSHSAALRLFADSAPRLRNI